MKINEYNPFTGGDGVTVDYSTLTISLRVDAPLSFDGSGNLELLKDSTLQVNGSNELGLNLGNANTWTALQTFGSGIDITGYQSPDVAIDLRTLGTNAPYIDTGGNFLFTNATTGDYWFIADNGGNFPFSVYTDGTHKVLTYNNTLDGGSGTSTWKGLATFDAGITGTGDTGSLTAGTGILGTANTWSALQTFGNNISLGGASLDVTSLATDQILQYNGTNWVNVDLPSGAVSSVSNSDGTLTISPTTGDVVASLNLGKENTWTTMQTFNAGTMIPNGQWYEAYDTGGTARFILGLDTDNNLYVRNPASSGNIYLGATSGVYTTNTTQPSPTIRNTLDDGSGNGSFNSVTARAANGFIYTGNSSGDLYMGYSDWATGYGVTWTGSGNTNFLFDGSGSANLGIGMDGGLSVGTDTVMASGNAYITVSLGVGKSPPNTTNWLGTNNNTLDNGSGDLTTSGYVNAGTGMGGGTVVLFGGATPQDGTGGDSGISINGRPRIGDWGQWLTVGEPNGTNGGMIMQIGRGTNGSNTPYVAFGTSSSITSTPSITNAWHFEGYGSTTFDYSFDNSNLPYWLVSDNQRGSSNVYWIGFGTALTTVNGIGGDILLSPSTSYTGPGTGNLAFDNQGNIGMSGSVHSSDERIKVDPQPYNIDFISYLRKLRVVQYYEEYERTEKSGILTIDKTKKRRAYPDFKVPKISIIANDLPVEVHKNHDGQRMSVIAYPDMTGFMIGIMQQQQKIIDDLMDKVNKLINN